jgi:hypothetical protein
MKIIYKIQYINEEYIEKDFTYILVDVSEFNKNDFHPEIYVIDLDEKGGCESGQIIYAHPQNDKEIYQLLDNESCPVIEIEAVHNCCFDDIKNKSDIVRISV